MCLELPWKPCNQIGSLPEMIPQSLQCRRCSEIRSLATKEEKLHQLIGLTLIDPLILNMFIFMYSHWQNILQWTIIAYVYVIPIWIYAWQDYLVCQKCKVSENHLKYSFNYSCPKVAPCFKISIYFQTIMVHIYMVTILFDHSKVPKKRLLIKSL